MTVNTECPKTTIGLHSVGFDCHTGTHDSAIGTVHATCVPISAGMNARMTIFEAHASVWSLCTEHVPIQFKVCRWCKCVGASCFAAIPSLRQVVGLGGLSPTMLAQSVLLLCPLLNNGAAGASVRVLCWCMQPAIVARACCFPSWLPSMLSHESATCNP